MARKKNPKTKSEAKQAEKLARAQWRALEKMGLAKPRKKIEGKLEPLRITRYKMRRLKQLAPALTGDAQIVKLGPKALAAAKRNRLTVARRYAIVPIGKKERERVLAGERPYSDVIVRSIRGQTIGTKCANYEKAVEAVMRMAFNTQNTPSESRAKKYEWKPPNEIRIRKNLSVLVCSEIDAIASMPKNWDYWKASASGRFDDMVRNGVSPIHYH